MGGPRSPPGPRPSTPHARLLPSSGGPRGRDGVQQWGRTPRVGPPPRSGCARNNTYPSTSEVGRLPCHAQTPLSSPGPSLVVWRGVATVGRGPPATASPGGGGRGGTAPGAEGSRRGRRLRGKRQGSGPGSKGPRPQGRHAGRFVPPSLLRPAGGFSRGSMYTLRHRHCVQRSPGTRAELPSCGLSEARHVDVTTFSSSGFALGVRRKERRRRAGWVGAGEEGRPAGSRAWDETRSATT